MIERIYNIILWRIYSFLRGTTKLLNGINPFTWLLQIPFIKKIIIAWFFLLIIMIGILQHLLWQLLLGRYL